MPQNSSRAESSGNSGQPEVETIIESILADAGEIATMPEVTVRIIDIVENPNSNMQELHEVIRNDPVLSTRILKVVNSALYGLPSQVANVDRAIVLLGLSAVKNIAMAASMTSLFTGDSDIERFSAGDIWKHSLSMGVGSKMLYAARKRPGGDEAFLAGLIADVGLLIERQALLYKMRVVIERFFENCGDFCALEREILGVDHQLVGMALGRQWRFPNAICQTIGHHHEPPATDAAESELTATVYLADRLACRMEAGFCSYGPDAPIDPAVLSRLKLTPADAQHVHDEMPAQIESAAKIFAPEDR